MLLANIEDRDTRALPGRGTMVSLRCRDLRRVNFSIPNEDHVTAFLSTIDALSIPRKAFMCVR